MKLNKLPPRPFDFLGPLSELHLGPTPLALTNGLANWFEPTFVLVGVLGIQHTSPNANVPWPKSLELPPTRGPCVAVVGTTTRREDLTQPTTVKQTLVQVPKVEDARAISIDRVVLSVAPQEVVQALAVLASVLLRVDLLEEILDFF